MTTLTEYLAIFISGASGTIIAKLVGDIYDHYKKRVKKIIDEVNEKSQDKSHTKKS